MQTRNKVCECQVTIPMCTEVLVSTSSTIDGIWVDGKVAHTGNSIAAIKYDYAVVHEFLQVTMRKFFEEIEAIGPARYDELPMHHEELKAKWVQTLRLVKPSISNIANFLKLFNILYFVRIELSDSGDVAPGFINLNLCVEALDSESTKSKLGQHGVLAELQEELNPSNGADEYPIPIPRVLSVDVRDNKAVIRLNLDF